MARFDQIWIDNRFRYRKTLRGSRLKLDDATGYLQSPDRRCFTAEQRKTVVDRFRVCNNMAQIAKSVNIDIQSIYDAIAVDPKFRKDIIEADLLEGRSKHLNDELVKLAASEKQQVISDLTEKTKMYIYRKDRIDTIQ